jgi:DNA-directed RNA polymerase II subunit RPB1
MNMHVPQSVVSMNEIAELACVPSQIISPRECSPILSIEQDVALGVYRMTKKHVMLSEKQLFNMLCTNSMFTGMIPRPVVEQGPIKKWSGRQLLSTIIPKNINVEMANSSYDEDKPDKDENFVRIQNGEILGGVIDKTVYQSRTKGLIHSIFNEYDPFTAAKFFDNTQQLVCDWLVQSGFSVGISDLIVDDKANQAMKTEIQKMKQQVYDIINDIHTNRFENTSIKNNMDYFEDKVNGILSKATDEAGKIGMSKVNDLQNRMMNMIKSKSKGKITNVGQMIACLGQNSDEGKRIPYGFENRTLPHFTKYDDGPESRGFVENSFISGLSPHEFFFHAIGGRGGLIDTAVKTSDTGYLQRKLVKAMEDCKINYDYTVRNASGSIIQFLYGEDGMDPTKIETQPLPFVKMDYSKLKKTYLLTEDDVLTNVLDADVVDGLNKTKNWQEKFAEHFQEIMADREFVMKNVLEKEQGTSIMYPVSFDRITRNAKAMFNKYDGGVLSDLDPMYVLDSINKLCDELYVSKQNKGNKFLKMLIRCYLSPKKVIFDYKYNKLAFDYVINQVKQRFYDSIAHPSEMVGVVAAQSIGEPATQMTLNTFHLSGVASASKAVRGVPRMKELMSVTKNIKTPAMNIFLKDGYNADDKKSTEVLNHVQTTYFRDIVNSTKVYYDPDDFNTTVEDDKLFIETYRELMQEGLMQKAKLYPWLLRFEFDRSAMLERDITMLDVYNIISEMYEDKVHVMFSDDSSKNLVFRMKIEEGDEEDDIITVIKALERSMLENLIIKGVSKITKVVKIPTNVSKYDKMTMSIESKKEWMLETAGTNLLDVLGLKEVDAIRTISNDVNEIYELFGVEAARQSLYNELHSVISDAGLYVNYRHIALLVDTMTNKGYLLSIDRHGINRADIGPFAKCSFEETTDMLIKAGIFAEVDRINGVSANIMLGQIAPAGTGDTEVLIDEWKLQEASTSQKAVQDEITIAYETFDELNNSVEFRDDSALDNLDFDFTLPSIDE